MRHEITDVKVQQAVNKQTTMKLKSGKETIVDAKKRILFTLEHVYHYSFDVYLKKNKWTGNAVYHLRKNGKRKECPYCKKVMNPMELCHVLTDKKEELLEKISDSKFRLRVLFELPNIQKK